MTTSRIINIVDVHLCLVDTQMMDRINSSIKGVNGSMVGIFILLVHGTSIISLLKGVKKDGREPLSNEFLIASIGG